MTLSTYLSMNAWREFLARVFESIPCQDNASPEWLVNPATRRRLKLDKYYPDVGLAFRFVGLTAKGQGRQSDWEAMETEQRDETREEVCRQNGVALMLIDPDDDDVIKQVDAIIRGISRASRTVAQGNRDPGHKGKWMPMLAEARERATGLRARLAKDSEQVMTSLAEAWRDREAGFAERPEPEPLPPITGAATDLQPGRRVRHARYGDGVITGLKGSGSDRTISILFDPGQETSAQERTFLISLVQDKLAIIS